MTATTTRSSKGCRPSSLAAALTAAFALPLANVYAAPGDPVSGEIRVGTDPDNSTLGIVDVARGADGRFVVVWGGFGGNTVPSTGTLRARRFAADGTPEGDEFDVSLDRPSPFSPAVAMAPDGRFVVAWRFGHDDADRGIAARTFAADGTPGAVLQASTVPVNTDNVDVAIDADGDFVVSWNEAGSGVFVRRFTAGGTALGAAETEVAHAPDPDHRTFSATVAMEPDGDFLVAWDQRSYGDTIDVPGAPYGFEFGLQSDSVRVRRFHADGSANGAAITVDKRTSTNAPTPLYQGSTVGNAHVAVDDDGDFVVAYTASTSGVLGQGIRARRYSAAGAPRGLSFEVGRRYTQSDFSAPDVSMHGSGAFAVAWQSEPDVFVRRYDAAGKALAKKVVVNPTKPATGWNLIGPTLDHDAQGGFAVTWNGVAVPTPIDVDNFVRVYEGP